MKNHEPVLTFAGTAIALLQAFGIAISIEQGNAIIAFVAALLGLVTLLGGVWTRSRVSPIED